MEIETLSNLRIKVDNTSISTKLRSGYGSCPSESSEISQILQLAEKDLEDYETALHELHMRTLSVQFHKSRLEDYMERLRSLRAPIRWLPNELLLRIFTFCCGGNDGGHSRFGIPNVIVISAVCTRWRELVNSYSQLWTRFAVRLCSNEDYDPEQDIATSQIELYLERSRDELLSMCISAGYWGEPSGHPGFQLLFAQSHRWRNLFFEGEFSSRSHPGLLFARLLSIAFPALETVEIDMSSYDEDSLAELDFFDHAPRLHTLSLFAGADMAMQGFPWGQITTLELDAGFRNVYSVVSICPNLQDLKIHSEYYESDTPYEVLDIPFTSKEVISFSIHGNFTATADIIEAIFSSFTFPSLSSLELVDNSDNGTPVYWSKDELQNLLSRSQCTLSLLSLCGLSLSDRDAVTLLQQLPSLQELSIHDIVQTDETSLAAFPVTTPFIQSLHGVRPSDLHSSLQPLVPHLKNLSLAVKNGDELDAAAFVETISSRWLPNPENAASVGISCLRSVELVIHNRIENLDGFSPLNHLERAGMRVFVAKCEEVERFKQFQESGCTLCREN